MSFPVHFASSNIASTIMHEVESLRNLDVYHGIICFILDDDGTVIFGNRRFESLFKNALGSHFQKNLHTTSRASWFKLTEKCMQFPNTLFEDNVLALCTGHVYEKIDFEIYFREGKFGIVGYKRVDPNKPTEGISFLEERMREIAFFQNHEFRPPVARILGVSSLSIASNDLGELKNYALLMRKDAEQLDEFIKKITALTNVSNG